MMEIVVGIPICEGCGKTRKYSEWKHRELKRLIRDIKDIGYNKVEFIQEVCPDCRIWLLPVLLSNAPLAVFKQVHHAPM